MLIAFFFKQQNIVGEYPTFLIVEEWLNYYVSLAWTVM